MIMVKFSSDNNSDVVKLSGMFFRNKKGARLTFPFFSLFHKIRKIYVLNEHFLFSRRSMEIRKHCLFLLSVSKIKVIHLLAQNKHSCTFSLKDRQYSIVKLNQSTSNYITVLYVPLYK